jgi:YHS domain-containing protein
MVRLVLWLLFISWATWLLRKIFHGLRGPATRRVSRPPAAPKPLYRDPWCGTHVSAEISHPLEHTGQVLHFCSAECRDRYRASLRRAAGG